jgi:hypothetical protein
LKISQLIFLLEKRMAQHGDIPVTILDDESGTYEPVVTSFLYGEDDHQEVQLATWSQSAD